MPVRNVAPNMEKAIRATSANPIVWLTLRLEPPSAHGDIAGHPRAVSSQRRKIDLSQQRCNRGSAREMFTRNTNITVVRQRPRTTERTVAVVLLHQHRQAVEASRMSVWPVAGHTCAPLGSGIIANWPSPGP